MGSKKTRIAPNVWFETVEDAESEDTAGSEDESDVVFGFCPEDCEVYNPCVDVKVKTKDMNGTLRLNLHPVLEDVVNDFFQTLANHPDSLKCQMDNFKPKKHWKGLPCTNIAKRIKRKFSSSKEPT